MEGKQCGQDQAIVFAEFTLIFYIHFRDKTDRSHSRRALIHVRLGGYPI